MTGGRPSPVVLLGATASGKSDVAMAYARQHAGVEIVAVDAMQVYRGMDIGTAKPTAADRALVAHHGIDLFDPGVDATLADYLDVVGPSIDAIRHRGATPLLVAGTGLYVRALTDPMEIPGRWPEVREELERRASTDGPAALHAELARLDPVAAGRMEPSNTRRVVRALEVTLGSGRAFSSFGPGLDVYPDIDVAQFGIRWERRALAARIDQRVHRMMDAGLLDEVRALWRRPGGLSRTSRQALGYKELIDHLEGRCELAEAVATVVLRTRQFAVRQERWFRRDPRVRWVEVEHDPVAEVLPVLEHR